MAKCERCKREPTNKNPLTNHHIMPQCFFKTTVTQELCKKCHQKIEAIILKKEKSLSRPLRPYEYFKIWYQFMKIETTKKYKRRKPR